jgi:hypothetical protein
MVPAAHRRAVEALCEGLAGSGLLWAVTGSVALAAQGVPVTCADLDVVVSAADAAIVERRFREHVVDPVQFAVRDRLRGHFGRLRLAGVEVEVLGDVQNLLPDGMWTNPPALDLHVTRVHVGARVCPVLSLAYLREAYAVMGRTATVRLIESALADSPGASAIGPSGDLGRRTAAARRPRAAQAVQADLLIWRSLRAFRSSRTRGP